MIPAVGIRVPFHDSSFAHAHAASMSAIQLVVDPYEFVRVWDVGRGSASQAGTTWMVRSGEGGL